MLKENKLDKKDNGVKIASIEGAEVLKLQAGLEGEINYNSVFSNSLLLDKLKTMEGFNISSQGSTKDIINVKFSYGYTAEETADILKEVAELKAQIKGVKKDNKETINRVKQLKKLIENNEKDIKQIDTEKEQLSDEKEINKLKNKIDTRQNKVDKYKNELEGLDKSCLDDINENDKTLNDLNKKISDNTYRKQTIRDILYEKGFSLDIYKTKDKKKEYDKTIAYKYWFRTGGKAKDGTDYFINEELFESIDEWQRMGIKLDKDNAKLVEMEVYKSLISSALVQDNCYLTIDPNEILVMKDLKVLSDLQDVIEIRRDEATGKSIAVHTKAQCENVMFDGMCLLQKDDSIGLSEGFRGLRHHFYKTAGFISDFQLYFQEFYGDDYENAYITDMFNRQVKVSTIKMLTTNNAMKWIKFLGETKEAFEQFAEYVRKNECKFGICKENHISKYNYIDENGKEHKLQRMSYQMLQTLDITNSQLKEIFKDSLDYIDKLKNDDKFFINHLRRTANTTNKNELLANIATKYQTFVHSYLFKDARKKEVYSYKETLKRGKLLTEAENETVAGNPLILLKYCTGEINDYIINGYITVNSKGEKLKDDMLPNTNSCYCLNFEHKQKIGCFRSPHNSFHNILSVENYINEDYNKYFKYFGKNVIAINMLYSDAQPKCSGMDEDLDFVYCSINKIVLEAVERTKKFPTIVNEFKPDEGDNAIKYEDTMKDRAKVDNILQLSQKAIGTSSNVAMLYLTQYWNLLNKKERTYADEILEEDLLDNVCILATLAQVAVDASKRRMIVGNGENGLNNEINRLRRELLFKEKPTFWQYTSSSFKNDEIEKKLKKDDKEAWNKLNKKERNLAIKEKKKNMIENLYDYDCPFNWLLKEVDKIEDAKDTSRVSDKEFVVLHGDRNTRGGKLAKKIECIIEEFQKNCNFLNAGSEEDEEEINKFYNFIYKEYFDKINSYNISLNCMSLMIARALIVDNKFLKSNAKIKTKLLNILYKKDKEWFLGCFKDCDEKFIKN